VSEEFEDEVQEGREGRRWKGWKITGPGWERSLWRWRESRELGGGVLRVWRAVILRAGMDGRGVGIGVLSPLWDEEEQRVERKELECDVSVDGREWGRQSFRWLRIELLSVGRWQDTSWMVAT
jgi:hypothetical protein